MTERSNAVCHEAGGQSTTHRGPRAIASDVPDLRRDWGSDTGAGLRLAWGSGQQRYFGWGSDSGFHSGVESGQDLPRREQLLRERLIRMRL